MRVCKPQTGTPNPKNAQTYADPRRGGRTERELERRVQLLFAPGAQPARDSAPLGFRRSIIPLSGLERLAPSVSPREPEPHGQDVGERRADLAQAPAPESWQSAGQAVSTGLRGR